jgi:UMF1 family MFS transporter
MKHNKNHDNGRGAGPQLVPVRFEFTHPAATTVCVAGTFNNTALFAGAAERAYLVLGCLIGAAGAPLQAASRTLLIRLAPKDRIAQYFGLFALTGKVTSFIGPLLIGAITAATASQKAGMAVLVVFFVAGLALLMRVRDCRASAGNAGCR